MIEINCECRTCKNIFTIQYGPSGSEAVVQCEKCGQKYYHLLFERMNFGRQGSDKMAYYTQAKSYMSGLKLASEDKDVFNNSERNALRGAIHLLVVQDERILEKQKIVGIKNIDVKFELQNYNVLFGSAEEGGVCVEVDFSPENCITKYYTVGDRPIKLIYKPQNKYEVLKYDWNLGNFILGEEYIADIFFSTSDVEQIAEDVFHKEVENLRKKKEL